MNIKIYIAEKEDDEDSEGKKSHLSNFCSSGSLMKQYWFIFVVVNWFFAEQKLPEKEDIDGKMTHICYQSYVWSIYKKYI